MNIIYVLLPLPLSTGAYAYALPDDMTLPEKGQFVTVPLGKKQLLGVVWEKTDTKEIPTAKLKQVIAIHNCPPLPHDIIKMISFISAYTIHSLGVVLKLALPVPSAITNPKTATFYSLVKPIPQYKASPKRDAVIELLKTTASMSSAMLKQETGATTAVLKGMITAGILNTALQNYLFTPTAPDVDFDVPVLNPVQEKAKDSICESLGKFEPILLDGVTGSGKTEVYFEAITQAFKNNKQVLVLLPEIALSSQWLKRFKARFGVEPCVWHSEITPAKRQATWSGVLHGTVNIVVGARSALHLPFDNLGLIVVDEEHDPAYKQEESILYNARDMAIYRAKVNDCPIILATATPSLESWEHSVSGRYKTITMDSRFGDAGKPIVACIDITKNKMPAEQFITDELHKHISDTFENGLQSMLFLNRRGYAPLTLCRSCGHRFQCNNCQAWLVQHKRYNTMNCHHCGYSCGMPDTCSNCSDTDCLASCGPGVERIYEEVIAKYPTAKVFMATSETLSTRKASLEFVEKMENGEIDIVIGTQIIAKGYDFKNLTLVGVIDGDMALSGGDLRAGERTFQILHQVAGRTGRGDIQGHAYIQTSNPNHPVLEALTSENRNDFLDVELSARKIGGQPPFNRLVGIIISDFDKQKVEHTAKQLAMSAPYADNVRVLGPADPHMPLLRGKHRKRLLINAEKDVKIQPIIAQWIANLQNKSSTTRIHIDVDPYSFF